MASSSAPSSIYSKLDTSLRQIRLLSLLPALRSSSLIKCDLLTSNLKPAEKFPGEHLVDPPAAAVASHPAYEALSYVWGDPSNPIAIKLNNRDVTVTRNLHAALLALRSRTKKRTLWVDALCINQQDLTERAAQVMLMRFIYEESSRVVIFLGPSTKMTEKGLTFVQDFHDRVIKSNDSEKLMQWLFETASKDDLWLTVALEILSKAWWSRSWIFQEILCAPAATVHCGRQSVSWAAFETMAQTINELEAPLLARQNMGMRVLIAKYLDLYNFVLFRQQRPLSPLTLAEALQTRRRALATDPRDKVFAVLGVCKDEIVAEFPPPPPSSDELRVDYTRSIADVYTGTVKHIVRNSHSLDILAACQNPLRLNDLPSWAPDWTTPRNNHPIIDVDTWGRIHHASGKVPYFGDLIRSLADDGDAIVVRGIAVTTIQGIGFPYVGDSETLKAILSKWRELAILTSRFHPDGTPGSIGEEIPCDGSFRCASGVTIQEGFTTTIRVGRTPTVDLFSDSDSDADTDSGPTEESQAVETAAAREHAREARAEGAGERALKRQKEYTAQLEQAFQLAAENRRFFITGRGGFMGLGPVEMELGDVVSVLLGSHVATILRRLQTGTEGREEFVIVGEAYMHGIMNGELFEDKSKENMELLVDAKLDIREFILR
ncbi:heterokaryon incompatibility protein-domain-containing protein [Thelonectria olida]|uniref:Heterokaryon incompatibility protein-domain-containing protein n=1 Tax=Thelonectria olida TaxID=1576542 RepID=A0A9P8WAF6_9HYPO|nr:heterokaryon incompatibility protein-domain-containing protein [Thelonectria olida]